MLDVTVFRSMRFTAANISVTFVFFALMGVMYFLTTYLQSVMGYSALEAGVRMVPIALGVIVAARLSVALTTHLGTKIVVAAGLALVGVSLGAFTSVGVDNGYFTKVAGALTFMGVGMGLAMAPATDAIMGSLPKAKAGIGSAMNDVVRELGGTLGVAVLGSIVSTSYASGMDGATSGLAPEAAEAASDSVSAAHEVAAEAGGGGGAQLVALADQAFVDAMTTAAGVAAIVALVGALFAALYLPARARTEPDQVEAEVPEAVAA
jgi:MFS transporter, DHA2 family, multidrug resistance protein